VSLSSKGVFSAAITDPLVCRTQPMVLLWTSAGLMFEPGGEQEEQDGIHALRHLLLLPSQCRVGSSRRPGIPVVLLGITSPKPALRPAGGHGVSWLLQCSGNPAALDEPIALECLDVAHFKSEQGEWDQRAIRHWPLFCTDASVVLWLQTRIGAFTKITWYWHVAEMDGMVYVPHIPCGHQIPHPRLSGQHVGHEGWSVQRCVWRALMSFKARKYPSVPSALCLACALLTP
jgi:hypothetical protein